MRGITDEKIKQIVDTLKKANNAINILERANGNRELFSKTKTEVQKLIEELSDRYSIKDIKIDNNE